MLDSWKEPKPTKDNPFPHSHEAQYLINTATLPEIDLMCEICEWRVVTDIKDVNGNSIN